MEETSKIKKEKIKTIAIVFLTILLILTFFSNTIMNHSLVEVSTETITDGAITTKVRGTGTVTAGDLYELKIDDVRKIRTINVKPGDEINQGDIVATLEDEESEELETAKEELLRKQNTYNQLVLKTQITSGERFQVEQGKEDPLYTMQDAITWAEADYEGTDAEKKVIDAQIAKLKDELAFLKDPDDDDKDRAKKINREIERLQLQSDEIAIQLVQKDLYKTNVSNLYTQQLGLDAELLEISFLQKKIKKLEEKTINSEIEAPVSGTVSEINVTAGNTVQVGDIIMTIQPAGKDFSISFSTTKELAAKVQKGDIAQIVNNWSGDDIKAVVKSIHKSKTDKNKMDITFDISGNVAVGETYTLSVGEKSANYDAIVPTSAVREDSNGKYVLYIETKSTPLGNRYYARRQNVEVITSDDTRTAITGTFDWGTYVITTTQKPVKENDQVRLAD